LDVDRRKSCEEPGVERVIDHHFPVAGAHLEATQERSASDHLEFVQASTPQDVCNVLTVAVVDREHEARASPELVDRVIEHVAQACDVVRPLSKGCKLLARGLHHTGARLVHEPGLFGTLPLPDLAQLMVNAFPCTPAGHLQSLCPKVCDLILGLLLQPPRFLGRLLQRAPAILFSTRQQGAGKPLFV
jgi:hypothetical protein